MTTKKRQVWALAALAMACSGKSTTPTPTIGGGSPLTDQAMVQLKDAPNRLDMPVADGKAGPPAFDRAKLAPATRLADGEANALLTPAMRPASVPTDKKPLPMR